jgi:hypothetical protein
MDVIAKTFIICVDAMTQDESVCLKCSCGHEVTLDQKSPGTVRSIVSVMIVHVVTERDDHRVVQTHNH